MLGVLCRALWGVLCQAHPYPPIAPVTTDAFGAKGRDTNTQRVRKAETGAQGGYGCAARELATMSQPRFSAQATPHHYPPIAPVTSGAFGAKGRDTNTQRVRKAETGAHPGKFVGP